LSRRLSAPVLPLAAALIVAATFGVPAGAAAQPATPASATAGNGTPTKVIVLLRNQHAEAPAQPATLAARAQAVGADQSRVLQGVTAAGGYATHQYTTINAFSATVPSGDVAALRSDPEVAAVVPDLPIRARTRSAAQPAATAAASPGTPPAGTCPSDPTKPLLEPEALQLTHTASDDPTAPTARSLGATGAGVKVAFIADGVDINNPDFVRSDGSHVFVDYQDFSGDGVNAPTDGAEAFIDSGAIAAQGLHSYDLADFVNPAHPLPKGCTIRVQGIAPGASLVGLKVFAAQTAATSGFLYAIDWAVSHDHVDVINESFGYNPYPDNSQDPLSLFDKQAVAAGVTVVASTGDAGYGNTIGSPGSVPEVIGVGATTSFRLYAQTTFAGFQFSHGSWASDTTSSLSSGGVAQTGKTLDLVAPGDLGWTICTADPNLYTGCSNYAGAPSPILDGGGTSQSSPFVAGAAALVIEAYRSTHGGNSPTPQQVKQVLTGSAHDLGLPADEQGAGLLDTYRAVQLARSLPGSSGTPLAQGSGLVTSPTMLAAVGAPGTAISQPLVVTNAGAGTRTISAAVRSSGTVVRSESHQVTLSPGSGPTYVDGLGRVRTYTTTTVTVPSGTNRLDVIVDSVGAAPGSPVRAMLIDPNGVYSGYTLPQGPGNVGEADVREPAAGTWTVLVETSNNPAAGYAGHSYVRARSFVNNAPGRVSPADVTLAPGQSATLSVSTTVPRSGSDAYAVVLSDSNGVTTTVPFALRAVVPTADNGGEFSGQLKTGNGRSFSPAQTDQYLFDVPAGQPDLAVSVRLSGTPANPVSAYLVTPDGEPLIQASNQRADADGNVTTGGGVELIHAHPAAGQWQLIVVLENPVSGDPLPQTFSGLIRFGGAKVTSSGVPGSHDKKIKKGSSSTAKVTITNTGPQEQTYFIDARSAHDVTYPLAPISQVTGLTLPATPDEAPQWVVPPQTSTLTVTASASRPVVFDTFAIPAANPDVEAVTSGNTATATHSATEVAPGDWGASPQEIGPFPPDGAPPATVDMAAGIHGLGFDRQVSSATGDLWLQTIDPGAQATPVTLRPGQKVTVTVRFRPTAAKGTAVTGTLFVDTFDPWTFSGSEVAAVPYAYRVG
jgi:hypothetical protein